MLYKMQIKMNILSAVVNVIWKKTFIPEVVIKQLDTLQIWYMAIIALL